MAPWPAPSVLLGHPLEALKTKENGSGKEREVERALHDEEREQRRLGTVAFVRRVAAELRRRRLRAAGENGGEGGMGKGVLGRAGALLLKPKRGGGGDRGRGGARLAVPELREGEEAVWMEERGRG